MIKKSILIENTFFRDATLPFMTSYMALGPLWTHVVEHGWIIKQPGSRATIVTDEGKQQLQKHFAIQLQP